MQPSIRSKLMKSTAFHGGLGRGGSLSWPWSGQPYESLFLVVYTRSCFFFYSLPVDRNGQPGQDRSLGVEIYIMKSPLQSLFPPKSTSQDPRWIVCVFFFFFLTQKNSPSFLIFFPLRVSTASPWQPKTREWHGEERVRTDLVCFDPRGYLAISTILGI